MKVSLKQVSNKEARSVEIAEDATVGDLMEKYGNEFNYDVKAIAFKGKNMRDKSAILSAVGIVDNELCVVVGTKRKEAAKAAAPSTASSSAPAPADPTPAEAPKETTPAPAPAPEQSQAAATAADAFLTGDAVNETVNMIMQMGEWSEEQVKAALSASFNNPDRAVDMLFSGSVPQQPAEPAAAPASAPAPAQGGGGGGGGGGGEPQRVAISGSIEVPGLGTLTAQQFQEVMGVLSRSNVNVSPEAVNQFLQRFGATPVPEGAGGGGAQGDLSPLAQRLGSIREWDQIRAACANDRDAMQRVMAALSQRDPELFAMIQQNQTEFMTLLRDGIPGGGAGGPQPGQQTVQVTPADREVVERLQALTGSTFEDALQAYFGTGKNEELAANLLLGE